MNIIDGINNSDVELDTSYDASSFGLSALHNVKNKISQPELEFQENDNSKDFHSVIDNILEPFILEKIKYQVI